MQRKATSGCQLKKSCMKLVYLLVFLAAIPGCSKSAKTPNQDELIGNWNWVLQHVGALQITQTPQNTGIQEQLQFGSDNKWSRVQNDTLIKSGSYRLTYSKNDRGEKKNTIHFEERNSTNITTKYYTVKNDTLSFENSPMAVIGGGLRVYAR
jgi:hypothetical protein